MANGKREKNHWKTIKYTKWEWNWAATSEYTNESYATMDKTHRWINRFIQMLLCHSNVVVAFHFCCCLFTVWVFIWLFVRKKCEHLSFNLNALAALNVIHCRLFSPIHSNFTQCQPIIIICYFILFCINLIRCCCCCCFFLDPSSCTRSFGFHRIVYHIGRIAVW